MIRWPLISMRLAMSLGVAIALSGVGARAAWAQSGAAAPAPAATCQQMTAAAVPDVRITSAAPIDPAPTWVAPNTAGLGAATVRVPFCRIVGVIEKEIGFELWLPPPAAWNGRYLGAGNGGDAGFINYIIVARGVNRGFAAASTDTGHDMADPHWALGHPDRLENYGFRAQHLLAVNAKKLIDLYYGRQPDHAYFLGCSGGGAQGMNEVQRYPADYDGIIAGASGTSMVPLSARFLMSALLAESDPAGVLTADDWRRVSQAAVDLCDAQDGVTDGVIQDPRTCRFDPAQTPGLSAEKIRQAEFCWGRSSPRTGAGSIPASALARRSPPRAAKSASPPASSASGFIKNPIGIRAVSISGATTRRPRTRLRDCASPIPIFRRSRGAVAS